jgi:hypothetical protein
VSAEVFEACRLATERALESAQYHRQAAAVHEQLARELEDQLDELSVAMRARRQAIQRRWELRRRIREARELLKAYPPKPCAMAWRAKGLKSPWRVSAYEIRQRWTLAAAPVPQDLGRSGVYVLYQEETPVYVGQAVNIAARIGQHYATKSFNKAAYMTVPPELLNHAERLMIDLLNPSLNRDSATMAKRRARLSGDIPTGTSEIPTEAKTPN